MVSVAKVRLLSRLLSERTSLRIFFRSDQIPAVDLADDRSGFLFRYFFDLVSVVDADQHRANRVDVIAPLKGNRVAPAQHISVEPQIGKAGMEPLTCRQGEEELGASV